MVILNITMMNRLIKSLTFDHFRLHLKIEDIKYSKTVVHIISINRRIF